MRKKWIWVGALMVLLLGLLAACTWQEVEMQLGLNLQAGDSVRTRLVSEQHIRQTAQGQEVNVEQKIGFGYTLTATEVDEEGNAWVDIVYDWILIEQESALGTLKFDSATPASEAEEGTEVFAAIVGKGFSAKIAPNGDILEIRGVDDMMAEVLGEMDIEDEELRATMMEQVSAQYNEEQLMDQMGGIVMDFPKGKVKIGDTWTATKATSAMVQATVETTYTLLDVQDGVATVGISSTISTDPADQLDVAGFQVSYDLSGLQEGTASIDIDSGWTISSTITQTLSGEILLVAAGKETAMPMEIDAVTTVEMLKGE